MKLATTPTTLRPWSFMAWICLRKGQIASSSIALSISLSHRLLGTGVVLLCTSKGPYVPHIKPLGPPVLYKIHQGIVDILVLPPHAELNTSTPQNTWICGVRVWFQFEKIAEKRDRRGDAKESFTEMNKNQKMQDGVSV